jgi:hypothetical protein
MMTPLKKSLKLIAELITTEQGALALKDNGYACKRSEFKISRNYR